MGLTVSSSDVVELWVKQEVRDGLSRYCRGLDRMDRPMADSTFHDGSVVDYINIFTGSGHGFIEWVWGVHAAMDRHSHQITNVLVEVDIDAEEAASESYVTVSLWTKPGPNGERMEIISRGRYIDRWAHRDGRWAIIERVHVLDQQVNRPLVSTDGNEESRRDADDPSYRVFSSPAG
jgi:hypothetical protein